MPKQSNKEKALAALLKTSTVTDAAIDCGLSEETLYRFLRDKDFLSEYRDARRAVVENAVSQLQQSASAAVETLVRNLHCENPSVEVRAAQSILDNAFKGVEMLDVIQRLEAVEDAIKK